MQKHVDIKSLLFQVAEGDEAAFRVLFNSYCHRVNSFATGLTRSETIGQETVQEIFMKIWLKREALTSVINFDAFLFTMVRNHVYNIMRRQALEAQAKSTFQGEVVATFDSEDDDVLSERKHMLDKVVDSLPQQQRRVFQLCQLQGLKYQEAAALLNISRLTVKTHMQQALKTIRMQVSRLILAAAVIIVSEFF
ncbi:RNA polymerase sigma-70 factor [Chryseolinea sp. T2]|uniref:RNA polymerase sigma factor n=1 Tax=Chryseolinea sp. T2 TaxID=3129255 RepID=UPI003077F02D